ncbi:hypothetical protein A2U01_0117384, partial [Trifolium medium]|nr:hypothetical protein [Trifolium medium]
QWKSTAEIAQHHAVLGEDPDP